MHSDQSAHNKKTPEQQKKLKLQKNKNKQAKKNNRDLCVQCEQHKVRGELSITYILLTSILLSSDPALLRLPRLPAQNM